MTRLPGLILCCVWVIIMTYAYAWYDSLGMFPTYRNVFWWHGPTRFIIAIGAMFVAMVPLGAWCYANSSK